MAGFGKMKNRNDTSLRRYAVTAFYGSVLKPSCRQSACIPAPTVNQVFGHTAF